MLKAGMLGLLLFVLEKWVFQNTFLSHTHPPFWTGALAAFYRAINEEVLIRLFLLTSFYFLMSRLFVVTSQNRLRFLWISNGIAALLFGLGHLPAAFTLTNPSFFEIFRILLLNGIAGLVFGMSIGQKIYGAR